jgi:hypothetical protein
MVMEDRKNGGEATGHERLLQATSLYTGGMGLVKRTKEKKGKETPQRQ